MPRRTRPFFACWCTTVFLTCPAADAQTGNAAIAARADSLVRDRFPATKCPGMSVTIVVRNEIAYSTALGIADIEQDVLLTTSSVHRLASLSKPITGTIIMDLVSQGKLNLDAPIRGYL